MARNFTRTEDLGFTLETWELVQRNELADKFQRASLAPRRCAHPDCRCWFTPGKSWAEYCSASCRTRDVEERRRIGLLLVAPAAEHHRHRHAKTGRERALAALARTYTTQLLTRWHNARAIRAAEAETRHPAPNEAA